MSAERFPPIHPAQRSPEQQSLCDHYQAGWRGQLAAPDGRLGGPLDAMIRSPELARRISHLSDYFRNGTSLDQRINEFAIIIAARMHDSHYEWSVHSEWACRDGLSRAVVEAVAEGRRPEGMAADEAAAYDLLIELAASHSISARTFERARKIFSEQQLVDLVAVFGAYRMVAGLLALADVPARAGAETPLKPR
jgi:4-carboxymuconolactone decarboxylase